jgi:lauroyl/myristoyl acyltransferase
VSSAYWLARGGMELSGWTPRPVRYALGATISSASYLGWRDKRLVTQQNMAKVLGLSVHDVRVKRAAFSSWSNYGRYASDFMYFPHLDVARVDASLRDLSQGAGWLDYARQALVPGKGAIISTAHFGNWDLAGALVAHHFPMSGVVETFKDPQLNELLQNQRREKKMTLIPMESSARRILRALQANTFVAIVMDRPMTRETGVEITFFGHKTYVPAGPATLAVKSGAAILCGYVWYGHHQEYYLQVFPPIFPRACQGNVERDREITRLTQCMYDVLEGMIRDWPTQWYMFRSFWPTESVRAE